ncbi:nitrate regulatory gene2 protein [Forsythia ovata]|uniref:Nitrate regulatory gene2 protein n=1 Tax=Forsythia ovata TaxID=205694 RepID=A0ABD1UZG6_9LAMI
MGCSYSRIERQEMVLRCKARKYIKQFVKARQAFSVAHNMYLRSLRTTGSVLLQFATDETNLHFHQNTNTHHHLPPLPPFMPSRLHAFTTSTASNEYHIRNHNDELLRHPPATTTATVNSAIFI